LSLNAIPATLAGVDISRYRAQATHSRSTERQIIGYHIRRFKIGFFDRVPRPHLGVLEEHDNGDEEDEKEERGKIFTVDEESIELQNNVAAEEQARAAHAQ